MAETQTADTTQQVPLQIQIPIRVKNRVAMGKAVAEKRRKACKEQEKKNSRG